MTEPSEPSGPSESLESSELIHVKKVWNSMKAKSPVYQLLIPNIELTSATQGAITARLLVGPNHLNSKGTLHGTVSACMIDWAGGMAIASTGVDTTGVSTDMHITYVSSAKEGDMLEIKCTASRVGSTLGFTSMEIKNVATGAVVSLGVHTKYVRQR